MCPSAKSISPRRLVEFSRTGAAEPGAAGGAGAGFGAATPAIQYFQESSAASTAVIKYGDIVSRDTTVSTGGFRIRRSYHGGGNGGNLALGLGMLNWLGEPMQILGVGLATVGLAFLGRSIAVVAANRGVKTYGMYRVVRHPMYAAYIVTYVGYVASYPTLRNCVITAATIAMLNARALAEERFLQRDSVYEEYLDRVRWRFVPYVY